MPVGMHGILPALEGAGVFLEGVMGTKFVAMDRTGGIEAAFFTEKDAREHVAKPHNRGPFTIHPIGAALPAKVESMGSIAAGAYASGPRDPEAAWANVATAVVAAHEARKVWETVTRWAVFDKCDNEWWDGDSWTQDKSGRALYATRSCAEAVMDPGLDRLVPVVTRRRVRAK